MSCLEHLKTAHRHIMGEMKSTFSWLFSYWRTIQNILMTLLAGFQVSDRCPLGYMFKNLLTLKDNCFKADIPIRPTIELIQNLMFVMIKRLCWYRPNISLHFKLMDASHRLTEPRCEKTGLRCFRPGPTQTRLYSHRGWLKGADQLRAREADLCLCFRICKKPNFSQRGSTWTQEFCPKT